MSAPLISTDGGRRVACVNLSPNAGAAARFSHFGRRACVLRVLFVCCVAACRVFAVNRQTYGGGVSCHCGTITGIFWHMSREGGGRIRSHKKTTAAGLKPLPPSVMRSGSFVAPIMSARSCLRGMPSGCRLGGRNEKRRNPSGVTPSRSYLSPLSVFCAMLWRCIAMRRRYTRAARLYRHTLAGWGLRCNRRRVACRGASMPAPLSGTRARCRERLARSRCITFSSVAVLA